MSLARRGRVFVVVEGLSYRHVDSAVVGEDFDAVAVDEQFEGDSAVLGFEGADLSRQVSVFFSAS